MTDLHHITVLGTGVLGSQIAYQTAFSGFEVTSYDINDAALAQARERFSALARVYQKQTDGKAEAATPAIKLTADLAAAVAEADLVIEAVPEKPGIKAEVYTAIGKAAPAHTIFATNSSTLLPSSLMEFTGRPDRFLALHFANQIWLHNTAEVMPTDRTDPAVYQKVVKFAGDIGMVPIEIKKEKAGYVLNSLLVPLLNAAGNLWAGGYADPETVDKTWRIGTGAPAGPFQIFDVVGLTTAYNIASMGNADAQRFAKMLKEHYIDQGKLGVQTGEGFYKYS